MTTVLIYSSITMDMFEWLEDCTYGKYSIKLGVARPIDIAGINGRVERFAGPTDPSVIMFDDEATALMCQLKFNTRLIGQQYGYEEAVYKLG